MSASTIIGAIEIGTSKVAVIIAEVQPGKSLNIVGYGQSSAKGIQKGEIYDFKLASESTHAAILEAEKSAGVAIEKVYLSQTGAHVKGFFNTGIVNIVASNGVVTRSDLNKVIQEAKAKQLPEERVYLHHIQNEFQLDGRRIANPLQMEGQRLSVGYWSVHGDIRKVRDHIHVINGFGLQVEDMIASCLASASMVVDESEKQNGVLVLDMGSGTTDYLLYKNGYVFRTGVLPVGGDHITNDLSLGLRINREHAERIKLEEGRADIDSRDKSETIWLIGDKRIGDRSVNREVINRIIEVRVEEIFSILRKQLEGLISLQQIPCGVVLTGGTSKLKNISTVASQVLNLDVRLGELSSWVLGDLRMPELATPLGLLHYAANGQGQEQEYLKPVSTKPFQVLKRFAKIFSFS